MKKNKAITLMGILIIVAIFFGIYAGLASAIEEAEPIQKYPNKEKTIIPQKENDSKKTSLSSTEIIKVINSNRKYDFITKKWIEGPVFNDQQKIKMIENWNKKMGR